MYILHKKEPFLIFKNGSMAGFSPGGRIRDRTVDLYRVGVALSQLSYSSTIYKNGAEDRDRTGTRY